ncbi:MAG: GNAT family N-acetyltransferase, partial [Acidobacteriota bacterium]
MRKDDLQVLESHLERINDHRHAGGMDKGAQLLERAVEEKYRCAERLAVYGSLGPGKENHHVVAHLPGRWHRGQVHGDLFDQGWGAGLGYPAMCWRPQGNTIAVDLLESPSLATAWKEIDRFEGSGYVRILVPVFVDRRFYCVANLYEMAHARDPDAKPQWILETLRLGLRQMTRDDLEYLAALMSDPEVMRYFPAPLTRDEAGAWIERQMDR